jgi:hypothetical protein
METPRLVTFFGFTNYSNLEFSTAYVFKDDLAVRPEKIVQRGDNNARPWLFICFWIVKSMHISHKKHVYAPIFYARHVPCGQWELDNARHHQQTLSGSIWSRLRLGFPLS